MTEILELLDGELKSKKQTMVNMLKVLMEKVDNIKKKTDNISRWMESFRKK